MKLRFRLTLVVCSYSTSYDYRDANIDAVCLLSPLLLTVMLLADFCTVLLKQRTTQGIASLGYAGMLTTVVGVFLCALERESDNEDRADRIPDGDVLFSGYALAFVNVFFDAMGAFLTKRWGGPPLDALDITVIRFGAASVMLLAVYLVMKVSGMASQNESLEDAVLPYDETKPLLESGKRESLVPASLIAMTRREWFLVSMGVLLVTCCNPVLYNYALFQIPLAFAITLASFGPIYAIPLVYLMKPCCAWSSFHFALNPKPQTLNPVSPKPYKPYKPYKPHKPKNPEP